ncbi:uncharacterized protein PV07_03841 [Cladophialophora immunda]|uniref:NACHT-NTPase and P-loop NTPases N-terminal domain-containing protein n=1 Tax=Cladophialophora immunda TaxID=569365 RepID=A0A0D2CM26_9EURO|nr:uncharacterized protein PV07_03841 [Cladophialophora immunda]KIW32283.1 hypothetical protein PV07_03841 [Cladophialophora immunda]
MVLDPLSAVSLVVNIFDLINQSINVISKAREVHRSGADNEAVDVEATTKDLAELTAKLQPNKPPDGSAQLPESSDPALDSICHGCRDVAQELLDALAKVTVEGKSSKWKSTRKALRSVWSKEKIYAIEKRLNTYRDEINLRLVADLRERVDLLALQQLCLSDLQRDNTKIIVDAMINDRHILQRALQSQNADTRKAIAEEQAKTSVTMVGAVQAAQINSQEEQRLIFRQILEVKGAIEQIKNDMRKKDEEFKETVLAYIASHSPKKRKALREKSNLISSALMSLETIYRSLQVLLANLQGRVKSLLAPLNTCQLWNAVPFPAPAFPPGSGTTQTAETARMLYYAYYYLSLVRGDLVRTDIHTIWPLQRDRYDELVSDSAPNRMYAIEAADWLRLKDTGPLNPSSGMSWTWRIDGRLRELSPGSLAYNFVWGMAVIAATISECIDQTKACPSSSSLPSQGVEAEAEAEAEVDVQLSIFARLFDERYRASEQKFTHASISAPHLLKDVKVWQSVGEMTHLRSKVAEWLDEEISVFAQERRLTPDRRRVVLDMEEIQELINVLILLTDRHPDQRGITLSSVKVCAVTNVLARCGINVPLKSGGVTPLIAHPDRYADILL